MSGIVEKGLMMNKTMDCHAADKLHCQAGISLVHTDTASASAWNVLNWRMTCCVLARSTVYSSILPRVIRMKYGISGVARI